MSAHHEYGGYAPHSEPSAEFVPVITMTAEQSARSNEKIRRDIPTGVGWMDVPKMQGELQALESVRNFVNLVNVKN